jgi:hypothetical protein
MGTLDQASIEEVIAGTVLTVTRQRYPNDDSPKLWLLWDLGGSDDCVGIARTAESDDCVGIARTADSAIAIAMSYLYLLDPCGEYHEFEAWLRKRNGFGSGAEERRFFEGWQPITSPVRVDEEESERVGRRVGAIPKQCWFNARKVVQKLGEYSEASYVEGIAVCLKTNRGFLFEHGWVCQPDGTVIDPTLPRDCLAYFPGLEFVGRAGIKAFRTTPEGRKRMRSPFFYAFGWGGEHSPSFSAARDRAMEFRSQFERKTSTGV